jgi:hypothetical protein
MDISTDPSHETLKSEIQKYVSRTETVMYLLVVFGLNGLFVLSFTLGIFTPIPLLISVIFIGSSVIMLTIYVIIMSFVFPDFSLVQVTKTFIYTGLSSRYKLLQLFLLSFGSVLGISGVLGMYRESIPLVISGSVTGNIIGWFVCVMGLFGVSFYVYLFKPVANRSDPEQLAQEVLEDYNNE